MKKVSFILNIVLILAVVSLIVFLSLQVQKTRIQEHTTWKETIALKQDIEELKRQALDEATKAKEAEALAIIASDLAEQSRQDLVECQGKQLTLSGDFLYHTIIASVYYFFSR